MEQYPHTISVTVGATATQDEDSGNFSVSTGTAWTSQCRIEPAGNNPVVKGADGEDIAYRFIVYMPVTTQVFTFGDAVTITLDNGGQYASSLKSFYYGQLNTRLWV